MAIDNVGLDVQIFDPLIRGGKSYRDLTESLTSYGHTLGANWLYKDASIVFATDLLDLGEWMVNGLGRHVVVTNQANVERFVGFVDEIVITVGNVTYSIGPLIEVGNRVFGVYTPWTLMSNFTTNSGETETAVAEDENSQTRFGTWEKVLQIGQAFVDDLNGYNEAELARDTYLMAYADPKVIIDATGGGEGSTVEIELVVRGYQEWLKAFVYQSRSYDGAVVASTTVSAKIQAVFGADINGIFSTDYSKIQVNASEQPENEENYQFGFSVVESCAQTGDGTNRWVIQIDAERRPVFKPVSTNFKYAFSLADNIQQFREYSTGAILQPWDVDPGYYYEVIDTPLNFSGDSGFNPNRAFIEEVRYTAPYNVSVSGEPFNRFIAIMNQKAGGSY